MAGKLEDRVREIIVDQLGVNAEQVTPEASFIDDLGADSLDSVELIMAFEEEFGATIPEEDAEKLTGDLDQRNVMSHLQFVTDEDIKRMAATGTIPAVAPLWTGKEPGTYQLEVEYVGQELADNCYPIKSFYDAGANVVFHSDYPVSPAMSIKDSVYMAEKRAFPKSYGFDGDTQRNAKESITREQALRALTINVARQWRQEKRMGSIEFGKLANMTVFDCDFLHDDLEKIEQANIVATIVDGEEVYKA